MIDKGYEMIGGGRGPGKKQKLSSEQLKENARSSYAIQKEINERRREKRSQKKTTDAEVLFSIYLYITKAIFNLILLASRTSTPSKKKQKRAAKIVASLL